MLLLSSVDTIRLFSLLALNATVSPAVLPTQQRQHEMFALAYFCVTGDQSECNKAAVARGAETVRLRTELIREQDSLRPLRAEFAKLNTAVVPDLQRLESIQKQIFVVERRILDLLPRVKTSRRALKALHNTRQSILRLRRAGR